MKKQEAVFRMQQLGIMPECIEAFENGKLWESETNSIPGAMYELDGKEKALVRKFEQEYNALVYHVIHTLCNIRNDNHEMYSMLYVSNYPEEWEMDREMLKDNIAYAYVYNATDPDLSEIGSIAIQPVNGGLVRIG